MGFERSRRLAPDHAPFNEHHRNVKSFVKWHWFWGLLQELVGAVEDGSLNRAQVRDQLASGPPSLTRPYFPLVRRDGIGGAQKFALCTRQILEDVYKCWHGFICTRAKDSEASSSSLLESMGKLQHARLSKSRTKNLQTHR